MSMTEPRTIAPPSCPEYAGGRRRQPTVGGSAPLPQAPRAQVPGEDG